MFALESEDELFGFGEGKLGIVGGVYLFPLAVDDEGVFVVEAVPHNFIN
jgi:hypothetical protein